MAKIFTIISGNPLFNVLKDLKKQHEVDFIINEASISYQIEQSKSLYECVNLLSRCYERKNYDYILPTVDMASLIVANINEKNNLPGIRKKPASLVMSKFKYYKIFDELNILYPKIYELFDMSKTQKFFDIKYPCILKPTNASGGYNIEILYSEKEKNESIQQIKFPSFKHLYHTLRKNIQFIEKDEYLIQEYIEGDICSIMGYVDEENIQIDFMFDIFPAKGKYPAEIGFTGPSKYKGKIESEILLNLKKFFKFIELKNSPFMLDMIIDNDKIYFIDFGARLSCNPMMLLYHRNINYASKLIDKILKNIDYKIDIEKTTLKLLTNNNIKTDKDLYYNKFIIE